MAARIQKCPHCSRNVVPTADAVCPTCRHKIDDKCVCPHCNFTYQLVDFPMLRELQGKTMSCGNCRRPFVIAYGKVGGKATLFGLLLVGLGLLVVGACYLLYLGTGIQLAVIPIGVILSGLFYTFFGIVHLALGK